MYGLRVLSLDVPDRKDRIYKTTELSDWLLLPGWIQLLNPNSYMDYINENKKGLKQFICWCTHIFSHFTGDSLWTM